MRSICHECCISFSCRQNLRRHNRNKHSDTKPFFECDTCGGRYTQKCDMLRHIEKKHLKIGYLFKCDICGGHYSRKNDLLRHVETKHSDTEYLFKCDTCGGHYTRKNDLLRHIEKKHSDMEYLFICDNCGGQYTRKSNLLRHMETKHNDELERSLFECDTCKGKYSDKKSLARHIFHRHSFDSTPKKSFECFACNYKFGRKDTLIRHVRKSCKKSKEGKFICLKCGDSYVSRNILNEHYKVSHAVPLKQIDMEFQSFDEFEKWIENIERENIFRFIVSNTKKSRSHTLKLYRCHRSGIYVDTCANKRRKRFLKNCGSKKLQGWCPAELSVKIESSSGICKVQYQETHVGHNVKDEKELCHVYLNKKEKMELAKRIAEGVPITHLKKRIYLSDAAAQDGNRIGTVNLKDLHNIASQYGIKQEHPVPVNSTELNLDSFREEFEESILYCKREGEVDSKYDTLFEEDFAIVLMDKSQESDIKLFGRKLVCFDGTHGTNLYNFILHMILVVDDSCEVKPAAFLITNRNDKDVIDILLKSIRERVGVIETKSIMTDMQAMYYDSWIDVMDNIPEYYLYCTWHVREAWRKKYPKMWNEEMKKTVKSKLTELLHESNPITFEEKLAKFLEILFSDPYGEEFSKYFTDNFIHNRHRWAYCYQLDSGINANMHIEVFHRKLKTNVAHWKKIETLTECLHYLRDYSYMQKNEDRVKRIRIQSTNKLHILRNRHHKVLDYLEKNSVLIDIVDEKTFIVESFEESGEHIPKIYTVTKNDSKECAQLDSVCLLFCNMCGICFHEYRCDCLDSTIRNNMCKHIHVVGISKLNSQCDKTENIGKLGNEIDNVLVDCEDDGSDFKDNKADIEDKKITCEEDEKKKRVVREMLEFLEKSLSIANSVEQIYEIKERFLDPIRRSLSS